MSVSFPVGREIWVNVMEVMGKMSVSFPKYGKKSSNNREEKEEMGVSSLHILN